MSNQRTNETWADQCLSFNETTEASSRDTKNISQPSELQSVAPPPSQNSQPFSSDSRQSPGRTVRELAHKLSQQKLQLGGCHQPQPDVSASIAPLPPPPLSAATNPKDLDLAHPPDFPGLHQWPTLEVDENPESLDDIFSQEPPHLSLLAVAHRRSQLFRGESSSMGTGAGAGNGEGSSRSAGSRLRKQLSSQFRDSLRPINTLASQARVEEMISSGTQCNVQNTPAPTTPTPTSSTSITVPVPVPVTAKPDPDPNYVFSPMNLEVDEAYCNGTTDVVEDDMSFVEAVMSMRRAGAPSGVRKQVVNGIPLRYQLSADAALRCQTVVKSRPRMRRRKKTGRSDSVISSAVTSAVSSPVIPPSIPSPHLNPYH